MNWREKTQQRLFKAYFEKTGIQLMDEPIYDSKWEEEHLEDLAMLAQSKPINAIPKLEKLVKEKPHIPSLKNYLQVAYTLGGKIEKAEALGKRTLKEHPNYLFAITTKILNTKDKEELKKIGHLLGNPRDVREIEGYDKPIHISAFKNYQHAAAYYESVMKENKVAVERLESLMDVGVEDEFVHTVAKSLAILRIQNMHDRLSKKNDRLREVESIQKVHLAQEETALSLKHEILNAFYSSDTFDKKIKDQILQLPKASLVTDLEKILEDSMKRWTGHYKYTEFDENTHDFSIHALFFLGALKSESSLPKVLDLIRMGNDFVDYWFSDSFEDLFYPPLYALGEGQLDLLHAFAVEENIYYYHKAIVSQVVSQVAQHQPNRRKEVIEWYRTVFQYFLDNPTNNNLIDTTFLTFCIGNIIDFRGIELFPIIEKLNDKTWIHDDFEGDIKEIKKRLEEPYHLSELKPLPKDLEEYYSRKYLERKVKLPFSPESAAMLDQFENKAEQLILKKFSSLLSLGQEKNQELMDVFSDDDFDNDLYYDEPVKTIVRTTPKIGRNDACPCGSGKKYKKCCLRK